MSVKQADERLADLREGIHEATRLMEAVRDGAEYAWQDVADEVGLLVSNAIHLQELAIDAEDTER
jgi:hypothetical protein